MGSDGCSRVPLPAMTLRPTIPLLVVVAQTLICVIDEHIDVLWMLCVVLATDDAVLLYRHAARVAVAVARGSESAAAL